MMKIHRLLTSNSAAIVLLASLAVCGLHHIRLPTGWTAAASLEAGASRIGPSAHRHAGGADEPA